MNSNWRNRPTTIDYIPKNVDVIISIDESGNSNLKCALKSKKQGSPCPDSEKYFTVTACAIAMKDFIQARDMVMTLKNKHWDNALFEYHGNKKRVCFHSREIRGKKDAFNPEIIDYDLFIQDLSNMMKDIPIRLYASNIDKEKHVKQYFAPMQPYDLCMNFVLERIMRNIKPGKSCIIVLESRGLKEDKDLLDQIKRLIDHGNNYYNAESFKKIKGVYFNPKWCQLANDQMSYWELELADLCAYPISKFFKYGTKDPAFQAIENKFAGYPAYIGKGFKAFP